MSPASAVACPSGSSGLRCLSRSAAGGAIARFALSWAALLFAASGGVLLFAVSGGVLLFADRGDAAERAPAVTAAVFSPDGKQAVVASQAGLEIRLWPSLEKSESLATRIGQAHDLAFSPAGDQLAAAGGRPGESGELEIFAWPSGESLSHVRLEDDLLHAVAWSADGSALAAGGAGATVLVLGPRGEIEGRLEGHSAAVWDVAFLPEGRLLSAAADGTLRLWKQSSPAPGGEKASWAAERTLAQHAGPVRSLAVRPGGNSPLEAASAAGDRTVRFWRPTFGRQLRFARLPSQPLSIDWSPAGDLLLAACADGRLRAIDPQTVAIVGESRAIEGWPYVVVAHADNQRALVAGEAGQVTAAGYRDLGEVREAP